MSARVGLVLIAMMGACGAAWAQDAAPPKPQPVRAAEPASGRAALEASFASVAARGARTGGQAAPSREELIGILVFMSLRNSKAHGA
jgi:hypothetical protein